MVYVSKKEYDKWMNEQMFHIVLDNVPAKINYREAEIKAEIKLEFYINYNTRNNMVYVVYTIDECGFSTFNVPITEHINEDILNGLYKEFRNKSHYILSLDYKTTNIPTITKETIIQNFGI